MTLASAIQVAPHAVAMQTAAARPATADQPLASDFNSLKGPQFDLARPTAVPDRPVAASIAAGTGAPVGLAAAARTIEVERPLLLSSAAVAGSIQPTAMPAPAQQIAPRVSATPAAVASGIAIGPEIRTTAPQISAPAALFRRSMEARRPMIEQLGGTKESEDAVDRGLAWLASVQEPDGRFSYVAENGKRQKKGDHDHDMALTGLSVLAFLAADHSPVKDGPYRQTVKSAVDWLLSQQSPDGDLRGPKEVRGSGSAKANMYDHGIATMALAEAALMTGDRRYAEGAIAGAKFICQSQNPRTGGWRYMPQDPGDTSVFGWQMMALHNAELLGFQTPPEVRQRSLKFLASVSSGRSKMLAGYTPGEGPTPPMTAEALFCRILVGEPIEPEAASEVSEFITSDVPKSGRTDFYFWYYTSLSLSQMQGNPRIRQAWDKWNTHCRDTLIAMQSREGANNGSWFDPKWGTRAGSGRVYSTALATLTLEVYYRYLPIRPADPDAAAAALRAANPPKPVAKPRGPVGPKFEAN